MRPRLALPVRMLILCLACFSFGVASDAPEAGWLRFDPPRPGNAQDPAYAEGWAPVQGFFFHSDEQGGTFGRLGVTRVMDKASPLLAGDVAVETVFEWVELDLNIPVSASSPGGRVRLRLENVMVADWRMHWDGGTENSPVETLELVYRAVTYIYLPGNADDTEGTFGTFNHVNASGDSGTYTPRDPDTPHLFAVTLARDDSLPTGQLRLSWLNAPGIRYALEFTDDLREEFQEVSGQPEIIENERVLILPSHLPVGFYRVIEK